MCQNSNDEIESHEKFSEEVEEAKSDPWYQLTMRQVFNDSANNFKRARELYQCVSASCSKNGYLYKLTEMNSHCEIYLCKGRTILNSIKSNFNKAQEIIENCLLGDDPIEQSIAKKLSEINFVGFANHIQILPDRDIEKRCRILKELFESY